MNIIIALIFVILLIFITCKCISDNTEDFSNNEAIQNLADVYNEAKLTVTDFVSTGASTLNTATVKNLSSPVGKIDSLTSSGITVNGDTTMNGALVVKSIHTQSDSWFPYTDGNNYLTGKSNILRGGPTTIQGNLQVDGSANFNGGIQAIVLDAPSWSTVSFLAQIKSGGYFNRNTPDGMALRFIFVYPNRSAGNTHIWHGIAIKLGQQFLLYEITPEHTNVGNLWNNVSNDGTWRGNL